MDVVLLDQLESGRYEVVSATTAVEGIPAFYHARAMAKTLVTGGTGFVGLHVVRELASRGDELRLLVREGSNTEPLGASTGSVPLAT